MRASRWLQVPLGGVRCAWGGYGAGSRRRCCNVARRRICGDSRRTVTARARDATALGSCLRRCKSQRQVLCRGFIIPWWNVTPQPWAKQTFKSSSNAQGERKTVVAISRVYQSWRITNAWAYWHSSTSGSQRLAGARCGRGFYIGAQCKYQSIDPSRRRTRRPVCRADPAALPVITSGHGTKALPHIFMQRNRPGPLDLSSCQVSRRWLTLAQLQ